jgi:glycosyltransferase involved in cell wall biosynthesis
MPQRKIYYVISNINKSLAFEWTAIDLKKDNDLTFILLNPDDSQLERFLVATGINVIRIKYKSKYYLPIALIQLCLLFITQRPAIVHAHLFDATIIGLAAAWLTGVKKRIYTRHTSTFHHLYFPNAVKYDQLCNRMATHIVSISQATDKILEMEGAAQTKLRKIYHGFDFTVLTSITQERILRVKQTWSIPDCVPCIGVISRHVHWKGVQYIIPAFKEFTKTHPEACLVLVNAAGPFHPIILNLLKDLPSHNRILIPFEPDIAALYKLFDLYVHAPIDSTCEAFGQTYVEALALGVPSIFTLSGIALEFVEHKKNAWVVEFKDSNAILEGLVNLWEDPELRRTLIQNGRRDVFSRFEMNSMMDGLRKLYDE